MNKTYHIYAKGTPLYWNLEEEEFRIKWNDLNAMVGLMKTDYVVEDLEYEEIYGYESMKGNGSREYTEPAGGDSY